jgi:hypothetical protein
MSNDVVQLGKLSAANEKRPSTAVEWADRVASAWNKSVASIMETAEAVQEADRALLSRPAERDLYLKELQKRGISAATISKLRGIGASKNFLPEHYECLPASYNYLYELADLKPHEYEKVYTKLSEGKEFKEAALVLSKRKKTKGKKQKVLFTVSAETEKLTSADKKAFAAFVDGYARRNIISIRKTPSFKRLFAEDVE